MATTRENFALFKGKFNLVTFKNKPKLPTNLLFDQSLGIFSKQNFPKVKIPGQKNGFGSSIASLISGNDPMLYRQCTCTQQPSFSSNFGAGRSPIAYDGLVIHIRAERLLTYNIHDRLPDVWAFLTPRPEVGGPFGYTAE